MAVGGRLTLLASGRDSFAVKEWLAADGDVRKPGDASLKDGVRCDPAGCTARLADGRVVAFAFGAEAFEEDCLRAAAVVSPQQAPGACEAHLIDRPVWRAQGATALFWNGGRFELQAARPPGIDRPWAKAQDLSSRTESSPTSRRPAAQDATPAAESLEAGD